MNYTHVTGGSIDVLPTSRPKKWQDANGSYSALQNSDDAFLLTLGWYPVVEVSTAHDPATHVVDGYTYDINAADITQTEVVRPLTAQELSDAADAAARAARRNVPNQGGGLPQLRAELDALKQTLLDQGILTGV